MSHAIRSLALAAALAALAPMASQAAALSSLSFSLSNNGSVQNGDPVTSLATGVAISGAEVFIDKSGDIGLTFSGADPIKISIDSTLFHLNALSLARFSGFELEVTVNGDAGQKLPATGGKWVTSPLLRICPVGTTCKEELLTEGNDPWITEITFNQTTGDFSGFNGLRFTQIGSTGGGTVPEPAGYGLAAMALLAAGAATRRRNAR